MTASLAGAMIFEMIDIIRKELRRQARDGKLRVNILATDKPDTARVNGRLDLYELAKAVMDRAG